MHILKVVIHSEKPKRPDSIFDGMPNIGCSILFGDASKSLWISALKFVFGTTNEMDALPAYFREFNGYVEVEFTPSAQMSHQTLRRSIVDGHIAFVVNGKQIERLDAKSFLRMHGIFRSYPFQYCIQCDDIESVVNSDAQTRRKWLMECCGLGDINVSKVQSIGLYTESLEEVQQIEVALWKIESHLCMFTTDHNKEAILQNWRQRVKDLGHLQNKRQMEKLQKEIAKLDVDLAISGGTVQKYNDEVNEWAQEVRHCQMSIKTATQKIAVFQQHENAMQQNLLDMAHRKQSLETTVLEIQSQLQCAKFTEQHSLQEKKLLQQSIENSTHEMENLKEKLDDLKRANLEYNQRINELEKERRLIFLRSTQNQRLNSKFLSVEERDTFIRDTIANNTATIATESRSVKRFQTEILRSIELLNELKKSRTEKLEELKKLNAHTVEEDVRKQKEKCDELVANVRILRRKVNRSTANHNAAQAQMNNVVGELEKCLSDGHFEGVQSMSSFIQTKCPPHLKQRYFGMVINNFTCHPSHYSAISVLFHDFLFYHIVDIPQTASEIIELYNAAEYFGKINFFALDVIAEVDSNIELPAFLSLLNYDQKYHKIFKLICDDIPNSGQFSTMQNADDLFNSNALIYDHDGVVSSLELPASSKIIQLNQRYTELRGESEKLANEIRENRQSFDVVEVELKQALSDLRKEKDRLAIIEREQSALSAIKQQILGAEKKIESKESTLSKHKGALHNAKQLVDGWQKELTEPMLNASETNVVDTITAEINENSTKKDRIQLEIQTFERKQKQLEYHIETHLRRRHDELNEQSSVYSMNSNECNQRETEIEALKEQLANSKFDQVAIQTQRNEIKLHITALNKTLDEAKKKKIAAQENQQKFLKEKKALEFKKKELMKILEKVIAKAATERFQITETDFNGYNEQELNQELKSAQQHIDSYKKTNSFDDDLLSTYRQEKIRLASRRVELMENSKCIKAAIQEYDRKITQAIKDTLASLQKRFTELFGLFVENGVAHMNMDIEEIADDSVELNNSNGLGITATFGTTTLTFEKLSLPHRRITALIFILTIQHLSEVNFLLVDCIDRVIPEPYHRPFAEYLEQLANKQQIIAVIESKIILQQQSMFSTIFHGHESNGVACLNRIGIHEAQKLLQ